MDTIFALASARGRAGVAVIRISGPRAHAAATALAGEVPADRRARHRTLRGAGGQVLDAALVLLFAEGASFTGEAVAELHLHGSRAVIGAVLAELSRIDGLRMAEAGEFTRRALENDRLDLTQVEGLGALIDAETEAQRRQAMRTMTGALRGRVEEWRARLIRAAALLEATIDFADEEVPEDVVPEVRALLSGLVADFAAEIAGARVAERLRDGFEVAIVGPPNAGKSTLLNRLAQREAAITSEVAGTTRDVIEVRMDLDGLPVTFLDTAGLRAAEDAVEKIGVARTRERAAQADVRVFLSCSPEEVAEMGVAGDAAVTGKADLAPGDGLSVSGLTGEGTEQLLARIAAELETRAAGSATATHERHAAALRAARQHLQDARAVLDADEQATELAAADLRGALHTLDVLIGRVDVETILGHIFASFCIGK